MDNVLPVFVGLVVGFLIGLTGMGGGALMTPFLLIVMKLDPVLAVGTDLTFAAITKIVGSIQHRREKNVSLRRVFWMACGSIPASFLGAQFILHQKAGSTLTEKTLPTILGITLIVVSLIILARVFRLLGPKEYIEISLARTLVPDPDRRHWRSAGRHDIHRRRDRYHGAVLDFLFHPLEPHGRIDVVHGALLTVITSMNYVLAGQIDWSLVGLLLIGSLPGAWLGAFAIKRIDLRIVRGILALVVIGAGIDLLLR